jgi:hypothetical protein
VKPFVARSPDTRAILAAFAQGEAPAADGIVVI